MNAKEQEKIYGKAYLERKKKEDPDFYKKDWAKRKKAKEQNENRKDYFKEYYANKRKNNPQWAEEQRQKCREYKLKNHKSLKEKQRAYKKTYIGKRSHKICEWRTKRNLKETDERMVVIFDRWYNATNCELCNKKFKPRQKCMEHHHSSGHFRNIACSQCNSYVGKIDRRKAIYLLELHRYFLRQYI